MSLPVREVLLDLKSYTTSTEWVFPNQKKMQPYKRPDIIRKQFKKLLKTLNIKYKTLYATRASYASAMVENNIPITYIQKQLNHKQMTTTMTYVRNGFVNNNMRDERIDKLFM